MSAHGNVDLGHTAAGWLGTSIAVAGFATVGVSMVAVSVAGIILGVAVISLAAVVTWILHLAGWGKPSGPRPADQWDWKVRDLSAEGGHVNCLGCRMAGRRGPLTTPSGAQPPLTSAVVIGPDGL
ncbi:HGxxPAAW family protein [Streptomyces sp. NPDC059752]|uniref:HGxxPAAW family protein n=1 Tax=unclassified Streptomyces TaxID=2593676 RepID=UPI003662245C